MAPGKSGSRGRRWGLTLTLVATVAVVLVLVVVLIMPRFHHSPSSAGGVLGDERLYTLVSGAPQSLRVTVDGVANGSRIPVEYTCDGADRPPRVTVSGIPAGNGTLILIVYDPDAPGGTFIHWLAYHRVSSRTGGVSSVFPSPSDVYGVNSFGRVGYGGPCPPPGSTHHYYFLVLYVPGSLQLPTGYSFQELYSAVKGAGVDSWGYAVLLYSRG